MLNRKLTVERRGTATVQSGTDRMRSAASIGSLRLLSPFRDVRCAKAQRAAKAGLDRDLLTHDRVLGWTATGTAFVLLAVLAMRRVSSSDIGFHLKAGERILSGLGWPRLDPFAFTVSDHAYVDTSWGYRTVVALVQRAAGPAGLVLFHAAIVLTIFGVLLRTEESPTEDYQLGLFHLYRGEAEETPARASRSFSTTTSSIGSPAGGCAEPRAGRWRTGS